MEIDFQRIDTLISNQNITQLLKARMFYELMESEQNHIPALHLNLLNEHITIPAIKNNILAIHNAYARLGIQQVKHAESLKNTAHLKEGKDADRLFNELIAPYKGKVIYVDFWGTWCGPCRDQMSFVGDVKKELAGKDVIFMYLANGSPEQSWSNFIKKMDLTGDNVVHYRLPEEQQAMIERKLAVHSFPTYMLVNKDGTLATNNAPRPELKIELLEWIDKLLKQ